MIRLHDQTASQPLGRHRLAIYDGGGTVFAFAELGTGFFCLDRPSTPLFMVAVSIIIDASDLALSLGIQYQRSMKK